LNDQKQEMNEKQTLYQAFAEVAKALAHGHRLQLLEHLAQGERAVEDLAARTGLSMANSSQHLQHLHRAGLVMARRDGKRRLYRLSSNGVVRLIAGLRGVAEAHHAGSQQVIQAFFKARDSLEPVTRDELLARLGEGSVTLLDVRPADEFGQGHLAGARNVPLQEIEAAIAQLDPATEIVAYCRGPWCVLSFQAVEILRAHGFKIRRLADGYPEWKAAGLPVERRAGQ
jgi:rhodanese-related sulfurtransferase/DNA-binding transcriptional ArsR family regulator